MDWQTGYPKVGYLSDCDSAQRMGTNEKDVSSRSQVFAYFTNGLRDLAVRAVEISSFFVQVSRDETTTYCLATYPLISQARHRTRHHRALGLNMLTLRH